MVRADVIYLINEDPEAHGVFDRETYGIYAPSDDDVLIAVPDDAVLCKMLPVVETPEMRFATIRSVGYNEFYAAKSAGIEPSIVFRLADYADYDGQKIVLWNGTRYRVVRTYTTNMAIDLTCELATNDRGAE